ncbi:MAG: CoA transferase [Candidatus Binatia bacterium]
MHGPLSGIRVLDFTWAQQGPYATVILSDLGAEIIKVEKRIVGDLGRGVTSDWYQGDGFCPYFWAHDRGKKSITLDLAQSAAKEIVLKLAEVCDVAVNNFRLHVMDALGIGYEAMKRRNPKIIFARATGFGSQGPLAHRPAFDIAGQAMGGMMSVTGMPGTPPQPAGACIADQTGATNLALAILAALVARERYGVGQQVEVSLYGSMIGLQAWEIDSYTVWGQLPPRAGSAHPLFQGALWGSFETADGWIVLGGVSDERWPRFCDALAFPELANDARFQHGIDRAKHGVFLTGLARERLRQRNTADWLEVFERYDLVTARVQNYADIAEDAQARANAYITEVTDEQRGAMKIVGSPIHLSQTPVQPQGWPPELGQHTEEILLEMGYTWEDIGRLKDREVI